MERTRGRGRRWVTMVAAAIAVAASAAGAPEARAAFGIQDGTFATDLSTTQAGAHPDLHTKFTFNQDADHIPDGTVRDLQIDLPPGIVGDPGATPYCAMAQVMTPAMNPCPQDTAVGEVKVTLGYPQFPGVTYVWQTLVYNIRPYRDSPAAFAFNAVFNARMDVEVRSDGDYGLRVTSNDITEAATILDIDMTLWGVPADHNGPGGETDQLSQRSYGGPGGGARRAFLTNATACGGDLTSSIAVSSWQDPSTTVGAQDTIPAFTGCEKLDFQPKLRVRPDTTAPGAPAGYEIDVDVPQDDNPDGLATPNLKDAKVTLPEGVTLSPSAAHGLVGCSSTQLGMGSRAAPACPAASKIGTVSVTTPVLPDPLTGDVYLGEPLPGNRYRMFLAPAGSGVQVKLEGRITPDQQTGQLTTTFASNPQLPFSNLHLKLKGGSRAPLANPTTCGTKTATAAMTSWAGQSASPSDAFVVSGCAPARFAPTWTVGTESPVAGASSPFTLRVTRGDEDQEIDRIDADLPPGLLGRISQVPQCAAADAAAGTCPAASRIGSVTVGAGPGSTPFYLPGRVYLTEGYKGTPFGLAFVVPAIAGPYDLGVVNIRAGIGVDRTTAQLSVASDPLPRILDGIPLRVRDIRVDIDRPGFMVNPTSCAPMAVLGKVASTAGTIADVRTPFQVGDCASLPLRPQLDLALSGKGETTDGKHPKVAALLRSSPGQANLRDVAVTLPLSLALDPDNAQALCKPAQAAARACPAGSIIGRATAVTPVLNRPLSGPVHFVEGLRRTASGAVRRTLPKLWIPLRGEVELDLNASTSVVDDALVTTFAGIPDAEISTFALEIDGGRHGVIVANTDICAANQVGVADYAGQNGRRTTQLVGLPAISCPTKVRRARVRGTRIAVTVGGLRAGRLSVAGAGVRSARRTLKKASVATVTTRLDTAARRRLARRGRMEVKLAVSFTPNGAKKARRMTTTVTVKR